MRKKDGDPSPKDIVQHMMTSLASTKKHVSRFVSDIFSLFSFSRVVLNRLKLFLKSVISGLKMQFFYQVSVKSASC